MTTSTTPRWLPAALCAAALAVLPLGLVSCGTDVVEPQGMDIEALQAALDEAHEAHDDQGNDTLDDIEAAAYRRTRAEFARGTISREEARRLSASISRMKARLLSAVESGRLTMEEACAIFRREIARLFRELREAQERRHRGGT